MAELREIIRAILDLRLADPEASFWNRLIQYVNPFKRTAAEIAAGITPTYYEYQPRPWMDVRRHGCILDGSTDDYTAFSRCITVAASTNTGIVIDGPMLIGTNITIPANVSLWLVGYGQIKPGTSRTVTANCQIHDTYQRIFDLSNSGALIAGDPIIPFVRPEWWHAGGADWAPAFNAALAFVQQTTTNKVKRLQLLNYVYNVSTVITFKAYNINFVRYPITFAGVGAANEGSCSTIKATGVLAQMFRMAGTDGANAGNAYYRFEHFRLDGGGLASIGIDADSLQYTQLDHVAIVETTDKALYSDYAEGVWINKGTFTGNKHSIWFGSGANVANTVRVIDTNISSNSGIGVYAKNGSGLVIDGGVIQSNAMAGVFSAGCRVVSISKTHLEGNAATGINLSSPNYGVLKADIWLSSNDANENTLSTTGETTNFSCDDAVFASTPTNGNLLALSFRGIEWHNNRCQDQFFTAGPNDINYCMQKYFSIKGNTKGDAEGDTDTVQTIFQSIDTAHVSLRALRDLHTHDYEHQLPINYFDRAAGSWTVVEGAGGTADATGALYYLGKRASRIITAGGATGALGITVTVSNYVELRGKFVWLGAWVNMNSNTDYTVDPYLATVGGTARGGYRHSTTAGPAMPAGWFFISACVYVDPSATSITAGFAIKLRSGGGTPAYDLQIVNPSLAIVGVPHWKLP